MRKRTMQSELSEIKKWAESHWAKSMPLFFALVLGIGSGILYTENKVIEDCKYNNSFRIGTQSFNCNRRV